MNPKDLVGAKKAPLRYVPRALDIEVAAVMETGAAKYGPFNWREQPVSAVTYAEAILRHVYAWLEGQDNAEDSGLSHIAHVAASAGIILDAKASGTLLDDRTAGPAADILRRLDKTALTQVPTEPEQSLFEYLGGAQLDKLVSEWEQYGPKSGQVVVTQRGEWPPDTRVGGLLTCCGQSEHDLSCPQWR